MRRAYRLRTGRTLAPFGDEVRDLFVGTEPVKAWQARAVAACGLELEEIDRPDQARERPCLLFADDVFFTEMALRHFLAAVLRRGGQAQLALESALLERTLDPLQDARALPEGGRAFDVFALTEASPPDLDALRAEARAERLEQREFTARVRLPPMALSDGEGPAQGGERVEAPVTARIVANVRHWIHLLRLSQLSIGVTLIEHLRRSPWLLLRARLLERRDPWALARRMRFIHPTARVHPKADVEASVIGPGAVVHAHAHVHRSVIGAGVEVGDHAVVMGCTLAERVHVLRASYLALSAAMPGGTLASYKVQLSLFGRDVFLTSSAWLIDAKLRGEVHVEHEGARVPIGSAFLGACLGHRSVLGAQVLIQAGRAIPNGAVIVGPPERFAREIPAYPEGTVLTVRDGRVVPV
jgi:carbonic anhydrase/acetyltransferase-like protein (isoleucine patch superfamily)